MHPNKSYCYGLLLLATLWLGCGPAKMDEVAVQQATTHIAALSQSNQAHLHHNAVASAILSNVVNAMEGDSADQFGWMFLPIESITKYRVSLLGEVANCRTELEKLAGKDIQLGTFNTPDEYRSTNNLMMGKEKMNGGRGDGKAHALHEAAVLLYDAVQNAVSEGERKLKIPAIAVDSANVVWEAKHFGQANALLALEELELLVQDALVMERLVIDDMVAELKLADTVQKYAALKPEGELRMKYHAYSDTVACGIKMEAILAVDNLPLGASVRYHGNGVSDRNDYHKGVLGEIFTPNYFPAEYGTLDFPTGLLSVLAPGGFAKGQTTKLHSEQAGATVTFPDGREEELEVTCRFVIRQPRVVITPGPDKPLQKGVPTNFVIDVPDLGEFYNPKIEATEANVQQGSSDKRRFRITPTGNTMTLSISSLTNGQKIMVDRITYQVK